jgi:hypothetical protein
MQKKWTVNICVHGDATEIVAIIKMCNSDLIPRLQEASTAVPSIMTFASGFYMGGHMDGSSKLCHKCVTDVWDRLMYWQRIIKLRNDLRSQCVISHGPTKRRAPTQYAEWVYI